MNMSMLRFAILSNSSDGGEIRQPNLVVNMYLSGSFLEMLDGLV